jgi:hypothetical protein
MLQGRYNTALVIDLAAATIRLQQQQQLTSQRSLLALPV